MSFGGGQTISQEEPRVLALRVNQSTYGTPIPFLRGTGRMSSNMLWYGDFIAIPHTETQGGGKGGGPKFASTTYTYQTATMLGLCSGVVSAVPRVWADKTQTTLSALGFVLATGEMGQAPWSHLVANHPEQAIGYSAIAYVAASALQLGNTSSLPNFTFEVQCGDLDANGDAQPGDVINDILAHPTEGVGWSTGLIDDMSDFALWCHAMGLTVSLLTESQKSARDWIQDVLNSSLAEAVWSAGKIKIVPYGDVAVGDWSPNLTPAYEIDEGDLKAPPKEERTQTATATNRMTVEYINRANDYNTEPVTRDDITAITQYGINSEQMSLHCIARQEMAELVCAYWRDRKLHLRRKVTVQLDERFVLLEPMDLVTLTFAPQFIFAETFRVLEIEDDGTDTLTVTLEEWPFGIAAPAAIPSESGAGYIPDYAASPGDAQHVIFEPPVELTENGLEVWVAAGGASTNWGGCNVWVSLDGTKYTRIGRTLAPARFGSVASAMDAGDGEIDVQLAVPGELQDSSDIGAARLASLCWVGTADGGEFFAYETPELTAANRYTLHGLVRNAYDSPQTDHAVGEKFVRVDDAIVKSGPLDISYVGATIYLKITSFNIYGTAEQSLSDVIAIPYTVTGNMLKLPPSSPDDFRARAEPDGTRSFTWRWVSREKPRDVSQYRIRYKLGSASDWDDMTPLHEGVLLSSPYECNTLAAGTYTFAIVAVDVLGNESLTPTFVSGVVLPNPRLASVIESAHCFTAGWPGTLTDCLIEDVSGYLVAADTTTTWDDLPDTWDEWTSWSMAVTTQMRYQYSDIDLGAVTLVTPYVTADTDSAVTLEEQHSDDGSSWTSWADIGMPISARYVRIRCTVDQIAGELLVLRNLDIVLDGKPVTETVADFDTSDAVTSYGAGDVRVPVTRTYAAIRNIQVSLRGVGAGWTWEVVDKTVTGPRIRIYNASHVGADALCDVKIEGV